MIPCRKIVPALLLGIATISPARSADDSQIDFARTKTVVPSAFIGKYAINNMVGVMRFCAKRGYVSDSAAEELSSSTKLFSPLPEKEKSAAMANGEAGFILDEKGNWGSIEDYADSHHHTVKDFCSESYNDFKEKLTLSPPSGQIDTRSIRERTKNKTLSEETKPSLGLYLSYDLYDLIGLLRFCSKQGYTPNYNGRITSPFLLFLKNIADKSGLDEAEKSSSVANGEAGFILDDGDDGSWIPLEVHAKNHNRSVKDYCTGLYHAMSEK